jgi:putative nucleotidyltransferase with HDIG domain
MEAAERAARGEEQGGSVAERVAAALVRAVDLRDGYTGRHCESVANLARRIGTRLRMRGPDLWALQLAACLHDVGKIGVPDSILNKPGPLDRDESERMRRHAALGAEMLAGVPGLETVAPLVRSHHERWDGRGYPDGLAGERIPLAARIVSACDALHAMTADRPYRAALDFEDALAELIAESGAQFDPGVVAAVRSETSHGGMTAAV